MAQKRKTEKHPFGFKTKATSDVFRKITLKVYESIRDIEKDMKPGDKLNFHGMELRISVENPKKKKK